MQTIRIHVILRDTTTDTLKLTDIKLATYRITFYRSKEVLWGKMKMGAIAISYCAPSDGFRYR